MSLLVITKVWQLWKHALLALIRKQTMNDNDPAKSIRAIAIEAQECLSFSSGRQCMKTFGICHSQCARANRTLHFATQAGEPLHGCKIISATTSPVTYIWSSNSPDCNTLAYLVWSEIERETNKIPCYTKDELKEWIMATFSNLNN